MISKAAVAVLAMMLIALVSVPSVAQTTRDRSESCRKFVQSFYDWYTPIAEKHSHERQLLGASAARRAFHKDSADDIVIEQRPELLSPELLKALVKDREAQAKNPTRNVSVDLDPYTGVQDFENADAYSAGPPDFIKEVCSVPVYDVRGGVRSRRAVLIVRVRWAGGIWVLADVEYNDPNLCGGVDIGCDLLGLLKSNEAYRSTVPNVAK